MAKRTVAVSVSLALVLAGVFLGYLAMPLVGQERVAPKAAFPAPRPIRPVADQFEQSQKEVQSEDLDLAQLKSELTRIEKHLNTLTKTLAAREAKRNAPQQVKTATGVADGGSAPAAGTLAALEGRSDRTLFTGKIAVNLTDGSGFADSAYLGYKELGGVKFAVFQHGERMFAILPERILSITAPAR